jgi:uncharacterized protein YndB with AHSA1/START domain
MKTSDKITITVQTTVNTSVDSVWKFWTLPEYITKWYQASDDWHAPYAENDLKKNGKFKTIMAARDGSTGFDFEGVYSRIQKNKIIEYILTDGRKVKVSFTRQGSKTKIVETFEPENINSPERQRAGWQTILDNFKKYTESIQLSGKS